MTEHGFVRVAAAVPRLRVADVAFNAQQILKLLDQALPQTIDVLVFPELCLTGYTCGDLFHQPRLQQAALLHLEQIAEVSTRFAGLLILGLPLVVDGQLANVAAVLQQGRVRGVIPKTSLANYKEFYEARWFAPADQLRVNSVALLGEQAPFGADLVFDAGKNVCVGVEICEDLWTPVPPSSRHALAGATVLCNLSASNEVIGKAEYRRQLVVNQSGRCLAGYVYVSSGPDESSTDLVFGGHCLIAENGVLLAETQRFARDAQLLVHDLDVQRLAHERQMTTSFGIQQGNQDPGRRLAFDVVEMASNKLLRRIDAHPFVPRGEHQLAERCRDIFHTQVAGLAKRLDHVQPQKVVLGVSGGLDSTLALLVACKTLDLLGLPRARMHALTMPGFGTTNRTRTNAVDLMRHLEVTSREIDIRPLCLAEMHALGHRPFGLELGEPDELTERLRQLPPENRHDLVFENIQARMRTQLLMNSGFVIGTGDLSELALGWCTYHGDHISMYNPNVSIPKTLVKFLVRWAALNEFAGPAQKTLLDVVDTQISPELLPTSQTGEIVQSTEAAIGPYELVDFFLFHFLRYAAPPAKILFLAERAKFDAEYSRAELARWLRVFIQRFFANQFKRSCLPDGPKVGSISLSPRGDWRMPSDASSREWLDF